MPYTFLAIQISILEIIMFQVGALVLGFVIHYFWNMRNGNQFDQEIDVARYEREAHEWRMKYYNIVEKEKDADEGLKKELEHARDTEKILLDELDETKQLYRELLNKQKETVVVPAEVNPGQYLVQLKMAQDHLMEHNESISKLIDQVEIMEQMEKKHQDTLQANQNLTDQLQNLRKSLNEKESELNNIRQQSALSQEMKNSLETAYDEFYELQSKLQKVEEQLAAPQTNGLRNDELEESNHMLSVEVNEMRLKQRELVEENSRLSQFVIEMESKLKEANMQRQQLSKRNEFLEELNKDLQHVTDHNKKLESQLTRLSEIEKMLARISSGSSSSDVNTK